MHRLPLLDPDKATIHNSHHGNSGENHIASSPPIALALMSTLAAQATAGLAPWWGSGALVVLSTFIGAVISYVSTRASDRRRAIQESRKQQREERRQERKELRDATSAFLVEARQFVK